MSAHGDHDMGHTLAGWTGTALAFTGSTATGLALVAGSSRGAWLGGAVLVLAALTTWVLHLAGWGKPTGPRPAAARHWRTRDTTARHGHPECLGCRLAGRRPQLRTGDGGAVERRTGTDRVTLEQGRPGGGHRAGRPASARHGGWVSERATNEIS